MSLRSSVRQNFPNFVFCTQEDRKKGVSNRQRKVYRKISCLTFDRMKLFQSIVLFCFISSAFSDYRTPVKFTNVSIRALYSDDRTLDCSCSSRHPFVYKAYYGFNGLPRTKNCDHSHLKTLDYLTDLTDFMNLHCANNTRKGKCRIPSWKNMKQANVISGWKRKYWLICFSCQKDTDIRTTTMRVTTIRPEDEYGFYPNNKYDKDTKCKDQEEEIIATIDNAAQIKREKNLKTEAKKQFAKQMINDELKDLVSSFFTQPKNIQRDTLNETLASEETDLFLEKAETVVGKTTGLLKDNEALNLEVDGIGRVTLLKRTENKENPVIELEDTVSNISISLPVQEALINQENSSIVSVIVYDDKVSTRIAGKKSLSSVISVSSVDTDGDVQNTELDKNMEIKLLHKKLDVDVDQFKVVPRCVFWNFSQSDWSSEGCDVTTSGENFTTCSCNHLTNFAVLLDLIPIEVALENAWLRTLTLVLCSLSVLGLIGSIIFFLQHSGCDVTDRIRINTHFCFNLLAIQLLMIFGIDQTDYPAVCKGISILLHFFLVATFSWSLMSGHQIYILLVQIFDTERNKMNAYYLAGYLTPLLMVGLSVIVDYAAYDGETYGTEDHCWIMMTNPIFYAFFLVPVCLVLIVNLSMLALVIIKVYKIRPRPHMYNHARGWFSLAMLLGATWAVGILGKINPGLATSVVFIVLNSLQGLLIFLFHVLFGQKCQNLIKNKMDSTLSKSTYTTTNNKKHSETYVISSTTQS